MVFGRGILLLAFSTQFLLAQGSDTDEFGPMPGKKPDREWAVSERLRRGHARPPGPANQRETIEIEVGELESNHVGDGTEVEDLIHSADHIGELRIVVNQERKLSGLGQRFVVLANGGEVVGLQRRQAADGVRTSLPGVGRQFQSIGRIVRAHVDHDIPPGR